MDTLKFNDGSEYECTYCAVAPDIGVAYVAVNGIDTIVDAAAWFSDSTHTAHMEYNGVGFDNYTDLVYIQATEFGMKARLNYKAPETQLADGEVSDADALAELMEAINS